MKLVRENIIFEKFTQNSDPVEDLNIGPHHIMKKYSLKKLYQNLGVKNMYYNILPTPIHLENLEQFLGKDIYYLGCTEYDGLEWTDKINKIITLYRYNKEVLYNTSLMVKKYNINPVIREFDTSKGKIVVFEYLKHYYYGDHIEIYYYGDLQMALELDLHKSSIVL